MASDLCSVATPGARLAPALTSRARHGGKSHDGTGSEELRRLRDAILAHADLERHAKRAGFRRHGRGWLCACHRDRRPSASCKGNYIHCFVCNKSWNAIDLEILSRSCDFVSALRALADECGFHWPGDQLRQTEKIELARERERDEADIEEANLWRGALLRRIDGGLRDHKALLIAAMEFGEEPEVDRLGTRVGALTRLETFLRKSSRADLLTAFRDSQRNAPEVAKALVVDGRDDDQR